MYDPKTPSTAIFPNYFAKISYFFTFLHKGCPIFFCHTYSQFDMHLNWFEEFKLALK